MTEQQQQQIARVNELSALARTSWLVLLAYLSYVGITLLAVQDADFFISTRTTELPLVGISIPTSSFFVFAPPLGVALYTYFHIHLLKLFAELADAPEHIDGKKLGDLIHPWLANDLFLTVRSDNCTDDRPLRSLSNFASFLLIWVAAPLIVAGFWWRSMSAHEEWLTLFLALNLLIAIYVGLSSWTTCWSSFRAEGLVFRRPLRKPWSDWLRWAAGLYAALFIITYSWLRTEGGLEHYANRIIDFIEAGLEIELFDDRTYSNGDDKPASIVQEEWVASQAWIPKTGGLILTETDLTGVELVPLPVSWRPIEAARRSFRKRWCDREGLNMAVCGHIPSFDRPHPVTLIAERDDWCAEFSEISEDKCLAQFDDLNELFEQDWNIERSAMLANLTEIDLSGRDLRNVIAPRASFVNANLRDSQLEKANLAEAQMEGANLGGAWLDKANLVYARLEGADLRGARLEKAILIGARLHGANLERAILKGALLKEAQMEGANLRRAGLEGAYLIRAEMERVDLSRARLEWANLSGARFNGANIKGATLSWSNLRYADLRGVQNLSQAQLDKAVGNTGTLLPEGLAPDTKKPYYIWNCWNQPTPNSEQYLALIWRLISMDHYLGTQREDILCGDRPRKPTGTSLNRHAPYPTGHPLE